MTGPFERHAEIASGVLPVETWNSAAAAPDIEFKYIDIASVDRDRKAVSAWSKLKAAEAPSRARQIVRTADILVSTVRPNLNAVAMVPADLDRAIASTGFCVLRCDAEVIEPRYLFHWVRSPQFVASMTREATGASYPAVSDKIVKRSLLPLPEIAEQRRLADLLDKAAGIREKRQECNRIVDELSRATFLDLFGDPVRNPKGWDTAVFDKVCDSRLGKMVDAKRQTGTKKKPYMRNFNVQWGRLDMSSVFEMDFDEAEREEFRLRYGDVLICEGGAGVGQTTIWRDELSECYFQKSLHRARPKDGVAMPQYISTLMWFLMHTNSILGAISSATIPHLTGEKLKTVRIPVPPYWLQQRFERAADAIRVISTRQKVAATETEQLFVSLVDDAFQGRLRGQSQHG